MEKRKKTVSLVETIPVADVVKALGTAPMKVKSAIKNGNAPDRLHVPRS